MTGQELVDGLRERDVWVMRMQEPSTVIIPKMWPADPLLPWLRDQLGCRVQEFQPEQFSNPHRKAFEVRLSTARVEVDETGLDPQSFDYASQLAMRRARAIWEAAAPVEA